MEYTVVEVPETQYASGGHDCTSIFHPASWAHFPVSEATKWWSKIPVKWPIVTHEYGQVSSFCKIMLKIIKAISRRSAELWGESPRVRGSAHIIVNAPRCCAIGDQQIRVEHRKASLNR